MYGDGFSSMQDITNGQATQYDLERQRLRDQVNEMRKRFADNSGRLDAESKQEIASELGSNDLEFHVENKYDWWNDMKSERLNSSKAKLTALEAKMTGAMQLDGPLYQMRAFLNERNKAAQDRPGQRQIATAKPMNLLTGPTSPVTPTGLITGR